MNCNNIFSFFETILDNNDITKIINFFHNFLYKKQQPEFQKWSGIPKTGKSLLFYPFKNILNKKRLIIPFDHVAEYDGKVIRVDVHNFCDQLIFVDSNSAFNNRKSEWNDGTIVKIRKPLSKQPEEIKTENLYRLKISTGEEKGDNVIRFNNVYGGEIKNVDEIISKEFIRILEEDILSFWYCKKLILIGHKEENSPFSKIPKEIIKEIIKQLD
jgi:hypothetical protein